MYDLERTRKIIIAIFCLSAFSLILTIIGFVKGGGELLQYGFMDNPAPAIIMFVFAGIFILSILTGIGFRALSKDIADELRYIDSKK